METTAERAPVAALLLTGLAGGLLSGLFGVGGGVVMVPLLVFVAHLSQHRAHATSLLAILPIAAAAALRFGAAGEVDVSTALTLAVGAIAGAQIGARIMHRTREAALRATFGLLMIAIGIVLVWP